MPWPLSPDRLSPSGPFLPLGGGIIKIAADCVREPQEVPEDVLTVINREQGPPAVPIQVPVPDYTPGNPLWLQSSLCWEWEPGEDSTGFVLTLPVIQIGADVFVMDNTLSAFTADGTGMNAMGTALGTTTVQQLINIDPAAITGGLTFGWFIIYNGAGSLTIFGENAGELAEGDPGRSYFTVAEMDARGVAMACDVDLIAVPPF